MATLCKLLDVPVVTIRKDLRLLEEKGLLYRTHGGASFENPYINEIPIQENEKIFVEEKSNIAEAAALLIIENDSIMIASGTAVQQLAKVIQPKDKLNVITSSFECCPSIARVHAIDVIQLGGSVRHSSSVVIGVGNR